MRFKKKSPSAKAEAETVIADQQATEPVKTPEAWVANPEEASEQSTLRDLLRGRSPYADADPKTRQTLLRLRPDKSTQHRPRRIFPYRSEPFIRSYPLICWHPKHPT